MLSIWEITFERIKTLNAAVLQLFIFYFFFNLKARKDAEVFIVY